MPIIEVSDLPAALQSAELIETMVAGANARASRVAPCLTSADPEPSDEQLAEAKLVLIGAIRRWVDAGSGAFSQQTAGPFSVSTDTRQRAGYNLWPSEITGLQDICKVSRQGGRAFEIDTMPPPARAYVQEGIPHVSQVSGRVYYSSDLGYLDADPV